MPATPYMELVKSLQVFSQRPPSYHKNDKDDIWNE